MVDIDKWFNCKKIKPKKKGEYILMVARKSTLGLWYNLFMFNVYWNGHTWDLPEVYVPVQWKYFKNTDQEKFGIKIFVEEGEE